MPRTKESGRLRDLERWGQQIHDALDRKPLPSYPDDAPARIASLVAEQDALRAAVEIAARDDCGPKTTKRILRSALRSSPERHPDGGELSHEDFLTQEELDS